MRSSIQFIAIALTLLMIPAHFAYANVAYGSRQDIDGGRPRQYSYRPNPGTPLDYDQTYDPRVSRSSNFMQSPYSSAPQVAYNGMPQQNVDPFMASEVSPYARYSPYLEVVGEGSDYTLGSDDVLTVIVRNQPDFSGRYVVDPEGNIQYNFVGDIKAEGRTKEQLKADISEKLKKFIRYPEVAVMISEYKSKSVYVFGYVNQPGKIHMKGDKITVKEAIVAAGLPRFDAAQSRVFIVRPSEFTEDGKPQKIKINVKDLLEKGKSEQDFQLQPGDSVVVGQRYFDKFVNNFTRIIGPMFQAAAVYELGFGDGDNGGYFRSSSNDR